MPEPSSEERLLRGLAELEATRFGPPPPATARPAASAPRRPHTTTGRATTDPAAASPELLGSLRRRGPLVALALPGALGLLALVLRSLDESSRAGALGFVVAVLAAPLLPVVGIPLRSGTGLVLVAVAASAVLWMVLGWWASRRSRSWAGFAAEYGWMVLAVWLGSGLAALAANVVLGRPVL